MKSDEPWLLRDVLGRKNAHECSATSLRSRRLVPTSRRELVAIHVQQKTLTLKTTVSCWKAEISGGGRASCVGWMKVGWWWLEEKTSESEPGKERLDKDASELENDLWYSLFRSPLEYVVAPTPPKLHISSLHFGMSSVPYPNPMFIQRAARGGGPQAIHYVFGEQRLGGETKFVCSADDFFGLGLNLRICGPSASSGTPAQSPPPATLVVSDCSSRRSPSPKPYIQKNLFNDRRLAL